MKKKIWLLTTAVVAAIGVGLYVRALVVDRPTGVTRAKFANVKKGMTYDEVMQIFQEPPGLTEGGPVFGQAVNWWIGAEGTAIIDFDKHKGRVIEMNWEVTEEPLLVRVRRWLPWK